MMKQKFDLCRFFARFMPGTRRVEAKLSITQWIGNGFYWYATAAWDEEHLALVFTEKGEKYIRLSADSIPTRVRDLPHNAYLIRADRTRKKDFLAKV